MEIQILVSNNGGPLSYTSKSHFRTEKNQCSLNISNYKPKIKLQESSFTYNWQGKIVAKQSVFFKLYSNICVFRHDQDVTSLPRSAAQWHPWCARSIRGILTNWRAGRWFRSLNWLPQHATCHAPDRSAGQKNTTHIIALFYHCTASRRLSLGVP